MTNINGQMILGNNYKLQQQLATMPAAQQQEYINYLYGTGAQDEVVFNTYNSDGNYCTDGKDDGKIGFFSALGNATQGVVKTIGKGIKGMFTGSDGKFSLLKSIGSVAMAAACIAFPAVGLAACAVGGVMGAIEVGKGIHKAATAETDAEAKAAWENIGGGTFTVAASVVGAKASFNAVQKTSTAANGLASLGKDATIGQKAMALGNDMVSSTVNRASAIKNTASALHYGNQMNKAQAKIDKFGPGSAEAQKFEVKFDNAAEKYYNIDSTSRNTAVNIQNTIGKGTDAIGNAGQTIAKAVKDPVGSAKNGLQTAKGGVQTAYNGFKNNTNTGYAMNTMNEFSGMNKATWLGYGLQADGQAILAALNKGVSADSLIAQYGYESVAQVINAVAGSTYAEQAI